MSASDMDISKSAHFREKNAKNWPATTVSVDTVKTASLSISYHRESNYSSFIYLCYATKANRNACHLSFLTIPTSYYFILTSLNNLLLQICSFSTHIFILPRGKSKCAVIIYYNQFFFTERENNMGAK